MAGLDKCVHVLERPVWWVDRLIIGDVISHINLGDESCESARLQLVGHSTCSGAAMIFRVITAKAN